MAAVMIHGWQPDDQIKKLTYQQVGYYFKSVKQGDIDDILDPLSLYALYRKAVEKKFQRASSRIFIIRRSLFSPRGPLGVFKYIIVPWTDWKQRRPKALRLQHGIDHC